MPADSPATGPGGSPYGEPQLAVQAETLLELGRHHVWLFRCPGCQCPLLAQSHAAAAVCPSCGGGPFSPVHELGRRTPEAILEDMADLAGDWSEDEL